MSGIPLSSGTTALTNALKQVFYIHKDVVSELKVKLDSLSKENDELKIQKQTLESESGPCLSCQHLKELNGTLQDNFNNRLRDKNAIIKHLEKRLKNAYSAADADLEAETISTLDVGQIEEQRGKDDDHHDSSLCENEASFKENEVSPSTQDERIVNSAKISGKQTHKLRLPKNGQGRKRYIEQREDSCGSKRLKTVIGCDREKTVRENSRNNDLLDTGVGQKEIIDGKRNRRLMHGPQTQTLQESPPTPNVLVAETENSIGVDQNKTKTSGYWSPQTRTRANEISPEFLVIPETLAMDDDHYSDDEDEECGLTETLVEHAYISDENNKLNTSLENSKMSRMKKNNNKLNKLEHKKGMESMKSLTILANVSMTSPVSPGIFDEVSKKTSSCDTPKSSKDYTDKESFHLERIQSLNSLNEGGVDDISDGSNLEKERFGNNHRLLRQTTLSQSFTANSVGKGSRKSKSSIDNKTNFYEGKEEEDAAVREAVKQSLLDLELTRNKKQNSPFKVPLSPTSARRSPRTKGQKYNSRGSENSMGNRNALDKDRNKKSPKALNAITDDDDNDVFVSSPDSEKRVSPKSKSRSSPRLSAKKGQNCNESVRGDHAKKALFLDGKIDLTLADNFDDFNKSIAGRKTKTSFSNSKSLQLAQVGSAEVPKKSSSKNDVVEVDADESMSQLMLQHDGRCFEDDTGTNVAGVREGLNGSLDPDVCLSMYLSSESCLPVTQIRKDGNTTTTDNLHKSLLSSSPTFSSTGHIRHDLMDETVAPNLMMAPDSSVREALGTDDGRDGTVKRRGKRVEDSVITRQRLLTSEADGSMELSVNDMSDCVHEDDDDESSDNVDETIAPSPQQQSLKLNSQSLSGMPSTSRSYKFVKKVQGHYAMSQSDCQAKELRNASSKTDELFIVDGVDSEEILNLIDNVDAVDDNSRLKTGSGSHGKALHQPTASLYDSFDVVPKKPAEFAHVQVVRKKSERDKLQGFSCKQCAEYYKGMNLSEKELQNRMRVCSRHKEKYRPPSTPEHFWSLSIRDTVQVPNEDELRPDIVRHRRRRRLEKKFKSRDEDNEKKDDRHI